MKRNLRIGKFIVLAILAITFFGFLVMALWNNVLAVVLNINAITFWQALGILLLSKILFSGFRGGWQGNYGHYYNFKRKEMFNKWQNMNPEEREKFKQEWQNRCRQRRKPISNDQSQGDEKNTEH